MSVSEKQLIANRANALKSTGAKTAEGKRNSSQNATRHGILSNTVVLETESRSRFQTLMEAFEQEFNPQTPTERALVENMVVARWRTLRIWALDTAGMSYEIRQHLDHNDEQDAPTRAALALSVAGDMRSQQELMSRYEARFDRQFHRSYQRLAEIRAARIRQEKTPLPNEPICTPEIKDIPHDSDPI